MQLPAIILSALCFTGCTRYEVWEHKGFIDCDSGDEIALESDKNKIRAFFMTKFSSPAKNRRFLFSYQLFELHFDFVGNYVLDQVNHDIEFIPSTGYKIPDHFDLSGEYELSKNTQGVEVLTLRSFWLGYERDSLDANSDNSTYCGYVLENSGRDFMF